MKHLFLEQKGPALWIYFNRPEVKNAFSLDLVREFLAAVRRGMKDQKTAVLVLSGKGGTFSAGGDIKLMSEVKDHRKFFLKISQIVHQSVLEIRTGRKPVIAAVPGYVGGIAFGLVLATDLRVASESARFNAATIRLGLVANGGATYDLPRVVGLAKASEILLLGEIISAREALEIGMINRLVSPDRLEEITQELAEQLASGPRQALGRLKKILNASLTSSLPAQLERERQAIAWSATTSDFREGMKAFLEKRKPVFHRDSGRG